jgi:hypothetical protein
MRTSNLNTNTTFQSLQQVTRTHISTAETAYYLNRKPQTLRAWACLETGPIKPIRVCGRLAWRVADIISLLNNHE